MVEWQKLEEIPFRKPKKDAPPSRVLVATDGETCIVLEHEGPAAQYWEEEGPPYLAEELERCPLDPGFHVLEISIKSLSSSGLSSYYGEWDQDLIVESSRSATKEELDLYRDGDHVWDPDLWWDIPEKSSWGDTYLDQVVTLLDSLGQELDVLEKISDEEIWDRVQSCIKDLAEGWDRARVHGLLEGQDGPICEESKREVCGFEVDPDWKLPDPGDPELYPCVEFHGGDGLSFFWWHSDWEDLPSSWKGKNSPLIEDPLIDPDTGGRRYKECERAYEELGFTVI